MGKEDIAREKLESDSEGNKYLYDALCTCYDSGIETYGCCAGHNPKKLPYIAIVIKKKNLKTIRNIIASLQDMKDISMEYTARVGVNNQILKNGKCRGFVIRGALNNRCEMFYRINEGIKHQQEHPKTKMRAELFFRSLEIFSEMDEEELQNILEHGRLVSGEYTNISEDLKEYKEEIHNLTHHPIITNISQGLTKKGKKEKERFEQLNKIYGVLQDEYVPGLKEKLKEQIVEGKKENLIGQNNKKKRDDEKDNLLNEDSRNE